MLDRVPLLEKHIDDYAGVVGVDIVDQIRELAEPLKGARIMHLNATAYGGGVAELLATHVPLGGLVPGGHVVRQVQCAALVQGAVTWLGSPELVADLSRVRREGGADHRCVVVDVLLEQGDAIEHGHSGGARGLESGQSIE